MIEAFKTKLVIVFLVAKDMISTNGYHILWKNYGGILTHSWFTTFKCYEDPFNGSHKARSLISSTQDIGETKKLGNELITCDRSFVLSSDVKNFIKKKANELWKNHAKNPIIVRMWLWGTPILKTKFIP